MPNSTNIESFLRQKQVVTLHYGLIFVAAATGIIAGIKISDHENFNDLAGIATSTGCAAALMTATHFTFKLLIHCCLQNSSNSEPQTQQTVNSFDQNRPTNAELHKTAKELYQKCDSWTSDTSTLTADEMRTVAAAKTFLENLFLRTDTESNPRAEIPISMKRWQALCRHVKKLGHIDDRVKPRLSVAVMR